MAIQVTGTMKTHKGKIENPYIYLRSRKIDKNTSKVTLLIFYDKSMTRLFGEGYMEGVQYSVDAPDYLSKIHDAAMWFIKQNWAALNCKILDLGKT